MMSAFDTVRADLTALRTDNEAFRSDFEERFTRLEAEIDKKPNILTILLATIVTMALTTGIIGIVAVLMVGL
jgi:hypothetical protein